MNNTKPIRITVNFKLQCSEEKAEAVEKYFSHLAKTGELAPLLEAMYECNVPGFYERLLNSNSGLPRKELEIGRERAERYT